MTNLKTITDLQLLQLQDQVRREIRRRVYAENSAHVDPRSPEAMQGITDYLLPGGGAVIRDDETVTMSLATWNQALRKNLINGVDGVESPTLLGYAVIITKESK